MMDNLETESISGILERTPHVTPFYEEVSSAIHKLRNGDASSNPLAEIIHGHVGALERKQQLGNEWLRYRVPGGLIVAHVDFLTIQDEFTHLEQGKGEQIPWNATMSLEILGKAIGAGKQYRQRHNQYFGNALKLLSSNKVSRLNELIEHHKHMMDNGDELLVALPSHLDSPKLWESFNLKGKILDRIPAWAKVYEHGLILASRQYRDDNPRGHDYFSYDARAVRLGEEPDMTTKPVKTWQHERSHGISDALLIDLLKLDTQNPIYEGLPGALGEDGRERKKSPSFSELLTNPYPNDVAVRRDTAYYSGARYWEALRRVVSKSQQQPWPVIISEALGLAVDMNGKPEIMSIDSNSKIARFLTELPSRLQIDIADVEKEYKEIAENNLHIE